MLGGGEEKKSLYDFKLAKETGKLEVWLQNATLYAVCRRLRPALPSIL